MFLKVPFLASKTRKKMKKYLPISETAGHLHTLFTNIFTLVFTGICRFLLCLEFSKAFINPLETRMFLLKIRCNFCRRSS